MAIRTPLKLDGSNNLIEMSATDIANIKLEMIRQYGAAPSVTLSVVASGGTFAAINDTRWQAGAAISDITAFPTEATTAEPSLVTVSYQKVNYTTSVLSAPADTNNKAFPVYQSGGNIYAMTLTDMRDTFVDDVITTLVTNASTTSQAGTYFVSTTTSVAGATLVSATPIFVDTIANLAAYTQPPEAIDQPTTVTSYYLHSYNAAAAGTLPIPLQITAANDLQQYTTANWQALLQDVVQYYATQTGYKIVYAQGTSAVDARGSAIVNTNIAGATNAGVYDTFNDTAASLYYAQEYPTGTATTITTNYITCSRG